MDSIVTLRQFQFIFLTASVSKLLDDWLKSQSIDLFLKPCGGWLITDYRGLANKWLVDIFKMFIGQFSINWKHPFIILDCNCCWCSNENENHVLFECQFHEDCFASEIFRCHLHVQQVLCEALASSSLKVCCNSIYTIRVFKHMLYQNKYRKIVHLMSV